MFLQLIRARVTDQAKVLALMDTWREQYMPHAVGFLGATYGFTDDGEMVNVARFASEAEARENSNMPEQGQWWEELSSNLTDVVFRDFPEAHTFLAGGSDAAGFVQIIEADVKDEGVLRPLMEQMEEHLPAMRPDVIGGVWAIANGRGLQVVYFTSESEARAGESQEPSAEAAQAMQAYQDAIGEATYADLHKPMMVTRPA